MSRFLKFAVAGAIGFVADAGTLHALTHLAHVHPLAARIPSFLVAVAITWWVNRKWTFRQHAGASPLREFLAYLSVQGAGALINFLVYAAIIGLAKPPANHTVAALAVASAVAMVANFIGLSRWVFTPPPPEGAPGSRRIRTAITAAALILCLALGGAVSVSLGQDVNFDLKNYHIYCPWAVMQDRLELDFFAAGIQTYFNPLLDFPHHAMLAAGLGGHPRLLAFLMGLPYGLLVFLTGILFHRAFRATGLSPQRAAAATAPALFLAATGSATVCQIGTVFNEIPVACLVIASLIAALPGEIAPSARRLIAAGALAGIAAGLKLTATIYAPALMLAIMASAPGVREAIRRAAIGSAAWFAAFAATYAWWASCLIDITGSPVFPMFNRIFRSPLLGDASFLDNRFKPHGWAQTLFYPLDWATTNQLVIEPPFRDARFLIALATLLLIGAFALIRLARRSPAAPPDSRHATALRFLCVFLVSGYAIWLALFSILRYAVPLELLASLAIVAGPVLFLAHRRTSVFIAGTAALAVASLAIHKHTRLPDFGHQPFGKRLIEIDAPSLPENTLVLFIGPQGSYLAPTLAQGRSDIRFMSITSDALRTRDLGYELWNRMTGIIRAHRGPTCVVLRKEYPGTEKILPSLGLDINGTVSRPVRANIDSEMTLHFARSSALTASENDRNALAVARRFGPHRDRALTHAEASLFTSGWSADEPEIRWSDAPSSAITFASDTPATAISIEGTPLGDQRATIHLNGERIFEGRIPPEGPARLPLPRSLLRNDGPNTLRFTWPDARQPGNGDPRLLAFAFRRITLHTDNEGAPPPPTP